MLKISFVALAVGSLLFGAFSSSSNYKLQNYGIGAGGTNNASSPSYQLNGAAGEVTGSPATNTTDTVKSGELQAQQANVPSAPTLSNGSGTYYNKLGVIINKSSSDASDYSYVIAASNDNFTTTLYVQADGTLGSTPVFQTYSAWGGASGTFMTGLTPNTTYQVKVAARQGTFSQSAYGAVATAATANPSLTFLVSPNSLNLGSLLAGSIINSSNITVSFATNGGNGGSVYLGGQNAGLKSASNGYTIPALSGDLSAQGQGFGAQAVSASQTSGGPLSGVSPYNVTGNTIGIESSSFRPIFTSSGPVVGGSASALLEAKAAVTTPSGNDYSETLTFIASASF